MISPLIQPVSGPVRDALEAMAFSAVGGSCRILTAWLTPDGLSLANDLLQRNRVSLKEIVVGINRGGTSARDLRAARAVLAQSAGVLRYYLDGKLAGPIYHPKVWYMESAAYRGALVGSSNLTREGLLDNVEAGIILRDNGPRGRNEASDALDELKRQIEAVSSSGHSVIVDDDVISRLVAIGAIPEKTERHVRDDIDEGNSKVTTADAVLAVRLRARSVFRAATPLPSIANVSTSTTAVSSLVLAPVGATLRYVRYYGLSEANRVKKYHEQLRQFGQASAGTFEVNLTMTSRPEEDFWGYPDRFIMNQAGNAREWSPRVRLVTIRDRNVMVTTIPSARLWTRIRDERQSEVRFRFTNAAAVRDTFPTDIEELTLFVVDRVDDSNVDYEVRLVGRRDPSYAALRPADGGTYEYTAI